MNLLIETIEILNENNKTPADVLWVGGAKQYFTWDEFASVANVEYSNGYGSQEVATDLVVVGKDFWLERHEYDGSEDWEFKTMPTKPQIHKAPQQVTGGRYDDLESLNAQNELNE
jgi:hypothetical protein